MIRYLLAWLAFVWLLPAWAVEASERVSVQLNWKHQYEFAAFYAALEQGYYRDAGLDVSIREGGPGIDTVKEVSEGRADFGVGTSSLVVDRYRGRSVVVLATLMQHSPIALLARRANGVNSVHDLAGQPVAVDPHDREEIESYLQASGIPPASIRLVDQTDWTLASVTAGKVAASTIYVSNEPFLIRGREHDFLLLTPRSAGIDLFGNMLFTTDAMLKSRPAVAKAFRDATLKGLVHALENVGGVASLIQAKYNTQAKSREHLLFEAEQIRDLTRPDIVEPGYMSPGRWRHVVNVYAGQGKMPSDFNLNGFIFDARPLRTPAWVWWALAATLSGLLLALLFVVKVKGLNLKLQGEILERCQVQEALQDSEAKYRELVDNASAIILRMAPDGTITYFNEYAERFFGYRAEELLGRHVIGTIVPATESDTGRDLAAMIDALLRAPEDFEGNENENITKDGRRVVVHWTNRVIRDTAGGPASVLAIGQDVTARKALERELARHRESLEEQVDVRTAELVAARKEAERLANVKSEFLANMSHEIRTPLNGVLGLAQIGLRRSKGRDHAAETFAKIIDSGKLLLGIINDILDFSKIDAGRMNIEHRPFVLRELLEQTLELHRERALAKGLALELEAAGNLPAACVGDSLRLQQVLANLLGNAVKFTDSGRVCLAASRQGGELLLKVTDTGIGMSPEEQGRIFRPFEQADGSTTRRYGGTGLGLAISLRLVELMGGRIAVSSVPEQGSCFEVFLPCVEAAAGSDAEAPPASDSPETFPLKGLRILAAEDNEINRAVLEEMLAAAGAAVALAGDGRQAVEQLQRGGADACDLVLMDVQMPVMDGLAATREIQVRWPGLPVLGQTAHALSEDRERCLLSGMVDALHKPFTPEELVAMVLRYARKAP